MTDTMTQPTSVAVDLPLWRAKMAAQAILPHVSTDDVTPVLTVAEVAGGYLTGTDRYSVGRFTLQDQDDEPARNTDSRHGESEEHYQARLEDWRTLHQVRYLRDGEPTTDTQTMLVPIAALRRISTLSHTLLPAGKVTEGRARVRIEAREPNLIQAGARRGELHGWNWVDVTLFEEDRAVLRQVFRGVIGNFPPVVRLLDEWKAAEEPVTLNFTGWNLAKMTRFAGRQDIVRITPGQPSESQKHTKLAPTRLEVGRDFVGLLQPNLDLR